jgi:hypothetical protein
VEEQLKRLQPPSASERIHAVVRLVLTSTRSIACDEPVVTRRFLQGSYGGREGCVQARTPESVADSVELTKLRKRGDHATAVVVPDGGPYDGERITVSLVRDPDWAVDALDADVPVGP